MQPDPKIDCSSAAVVALGGQEWFLPKLVMRQNRVVTPALSKLIPIIERVEKGEDPLSIFTEEVFDLFNTALHAALTRAYSSLSKDAYLDLPITTAEMMASFPALLESVGLWNKVETQGETTGETLIPSTAPPMPSTT